MLRYQLQEYIISVNGKWQKITDAWLRELETSDKKKYNAWDDYISRYQKNPLAFFLPHGRPRDDELGNDGLALVNDTEHDLILLTAGNQWGKSILGAAYILLRSLPCDKSWPCFAQHGVKYHEWTGPKQIIIASYSWDEVDTVWNTYRKIMPREMLGSYAPFWGHFKGETSRPQNLRFHNVTKKIKWPCDTVFTFLSYVQSLTHWEGKQCDIGHLDEQCPEDKFDALTARQTTRGGEHGFTPIIMTLTGHVVPERPDTGAAGWIKRKIVDGKLTKGRKVGQYKITLESVPDLIISPEKKRKMHVQWVVEPEQYRDEKKKREAEARYYGGWEVGGGIVLSEWNPEFHLIEPFDIWKYKPTLYRMIDHGQNPCAAAIFAVMPWGDSVMIQEYYVYGKNIHDNALGIVEWCGNERKLVKWEDGSQTYDEVFKKMEFRASELDTRSFNKKADDSNLTVGRLYNNYGCTCTATTGKHDNNRKHVQTDLGTIPVLKDKLSIRKDRKHIDIELGRPRSKTLARLGAPMLYVFSTCKNVRTEIEAWLGTGDDRDDLISCLKYFTARERAYLGDYGIFEKPEEPKPRVSSITGY